MDVTELLAFALQNKASDLHLSSGSPAILRINGAMKPVKTGPLTADAVREMILAVMTEEQRAEFEREHEIDFAIAFGDSARFRVNAFTITRGPAAVFRSIPSAIPRLDDLGAPESFRRFAELERGIVLVTGPTGSGKSTTLAAMIDHINRHTAKHILTIEDPVEFIHQPIRSLVNHREVGPHTRSFARALKSALREDPDVILVGEMRDHETIALALTAAETGHLVLGTLHTSSAPKTIDRIIDVFPSGDKEMVRAMLAGSLRAVISQILLPRIDARGGRVAAHEVLVATPAVCNLIRENKVPQIVSMMQMGQRYGMQTMEDAVKALVDKGLVAQEEMARFAIATKDDDGGKGQRKGGAPAAPQTPAEPAEAAPSAPAAATPAPAPPPKPKRSGISSLFRS